MKAKLILLLLLPIACFAQRRNSHVSETEKPSLDDCPDFNDNSKPNGSVDFYKMLRTRRRSTPKEEIASNTPPPAPISVSKTTGLPIYQPISETTLTKTNPGIVISPIPTEEPKPGKETISTNEERENTIVKSATANEEKSTGKSTESVSSIKKETTSGKSFTAKKEKAEKKKKEKKKKPARRKKTKKFKKGKSSACPNF